MQAVLKINCFGTSHSRPMTLRIGPRNFLASKNTLSDLSWPSIFQNK